MVLRLRVPVTNGEGLGLKRGGVKEAPWRENSRILEATTGFEPVIRVLQTHALPLGYVARGTTRAGRAPLYPGPSGSRSRLWMHEHGPATHRPDQADAERED